MKVIKNIITMIGASMVIAALAFMAPRDSSAMGSPPKPNADIEQARITEQLAAESNAKVGMPAITNFAEKEMAKWLYELRDDPNLRTFTYIVTISGKLVKICDSVGYGINASVQMSSPEKKVRMDLGRYNGDGSMPQPEPNGLFMPEGLAATYVACTFPGLDEVKALYIEPEIIVSPVDLNAVGVGQ